MEFTTLELNGYGDGSGYGYGYGYGSGDGYGYGSWDGSGYGSGDGDEKNNYINAILAPIKNDFLDHEICFWRCTKENKPANGGSKTVASVGLVEKINGPLSICTSNALHGTLNLKKWKGEHYWIVALKNPVQKQEDKMASLERVFVKDMGICPWN